MFLRIVLILGVAFQFVGCATATKTHSLPEKYKTVAIEVSSEIPAWNQTVQTLQEEILRTFKTGGAFDAVGLSESLANPDLLVKTSITDYDSIYGLGADVEVQDIKTGRIIESVHVSTVTVWVVAQGAVKRAALAIYNMTVQGLSGKEVEVDTVYDSVRRKTPLSKEGRIELKVPEKEVVPPPGVPAEADIPDVAESKDVMPQRWALVVGISNYRDTRIPGLRYAARDAKSFHDWLVSPTGGGYAPSRTRLLLNEQATFANIRESLFTWLGGAIEEDVVLIYFAGHGSPESPHTPENLFLLPHDVDYDRIPTTGFPMWDVETALKRFIRAKRVVVIADACHSGGVGQQFDIARRAGTTETPNPISAGLQDLSDIGEGVCVLSASDDKQFSQESRKWGGGHGVFTYFLLQGLKGSADYNRDSSVTLGELIPYLSEHVRRETRNAQSPTVSGRFDPALSIGGR